MVAYFTETIHQGYRQSFEVTQWLVDEQSPFQRIRIFDTPRNGRVLALDDIVQITSRDYQAYAEMLSHAPVYALKARGIVPKRVLIIGGGDATVADAVLRHSDLDTVDMVEIDARVVEHCKLYFERQNARAFDDARFHLHIRDAFDFLAEGTAGNYDVVIADRPDPVGPGEVLFADRFYDHLNAAMAPHGIAAFQCGAPFFQPEELTEDIVRLRRVFGKAGCYLTVVPTYVGGFMALSWASRETDFAGTDGAKIAAAWTHAPVETGYYTTEVHRAAFALPVWLERIAGGKAEAGPAPDRTAETP